MLVHWTMPCWAHLVVVGPADVVGPVVISVYYAGEVGVAAPVDIYVGTSNDFHPGL